MRPAILIIEPSREIADALGDVVATARYMPIVRPHVDRLSDIAITPAAIIVRVTFHGSSEPAHTVLERLPVKRPPVVAIAWAEAEAAEAARLKCDIVLRAPHEVHQLCQALGRIVQT